MIYGLDVSVCQGAIDWMRVPDEIDFVVIRAAIGVTGVDATFAKNRDGARASGRLWGAYDFLLPEQPVEPQIENFWRAIGDTETSLPLAIDLETFGKGMRPAELVDALRRAVDAVAKKDARPPLVYSYPAYLIQLGQALAAATELARCPLWLADYGHGERPPEGTMFYRVPLWTRPTIVQTSGNGSSRVPGIAGAVDHDIFLGSIEELRALCGLPPKVVVQDQPIVHPRVIVDPDSDPTLPCAAAPTSSTRMPPVESVDDTPDDAA